MAIRLNFGMSAAAVAAMALSSAAHAGLSVQAHAMSNVACVHNVCTATAPDAIMSYKRLQDMLATADVTLVAGGGANDIEIAAPLSWTSVHRLTLDAPHSVTVTKPVNVTGTGALTVTTNDGGSGGTFSFAGGTIHFWDISSSLIVNGGTYTLANDIASLASGIAAHPSNNFALANAYDAAPDGTYTAAAIPTTLTGAFEGLGNTISHLTIKNTTNTGNIGLFASIGATGSAENVALKGVFITVTRPKESLTAAHVGGLVGLNAGSVLGVTVTGSIWAASGSYPRHGAILYESDGGVAGINDGNIANAASSVAIRAQEESYSGGLVGSTEESHSSAISNSYATGSVTGKGSTQTTAGGLVGMFNGSGTITNSYATGTLSNSNGFTGSAGGLVGVFYGTTISGSHATGPVSQADQGGGLVGINVGTIADSYATGDVSALSLGGGAVGGLIGVNEGTAERSFATGLVTGTANPKAGGLIGYNGKYANSAATISNCYALGNVTAGSGVQTAGAGVGGLIGADVNGTIQTSYSIGAPTASGETYIGGLLGIDQASGTTLASTYWDTTTSGITNSSQGAGNVPNVPGITGLSDTALKAALPSGFDSGVWGQSGGINNGLPYLLSNPPPG